MSESLSNVERDVVDRVEAKLIVKAPGFDPAIITVLIEMLTDLLAGCSNSASNASPTEAIERVKNLSRFERSMIKSRLKRKAKEAGIKNASALCDKAIESVTEVAREATLDDQKTFAESVLPLAKSDFEMI